MGLPDGAQLVRLNPATGKVQARIDLQTPDVLAFDGTAVYACGGGSLHRVDPITNAVSWSTKLQQDTFLPEIVFGGGYIWTVDDASGKVWKVESTGTLADTFDVGIGALPLAPMGDTMWVGVQDAGLLVGIQMVTGATRTIQIGHLIGTLRAGHDELPSPSSARPRRPSPPSTAMC